MQTPINEKANSSSRQIWVDADASPKVIKEILYKACERTKTNMILVANQLLETPRSRYIRSVQVASGFDVADNYIVENSNKGDVVITADIPLAAELVAKDCIVLNPRGERYTKENIGQTLNMRDFMDSLRSTGVQTGGPDSFSKSDRLAFANSLDRVLAQGS
ncbi:MAG: YaiI/YqxD family protein [Arenicellales bacterium]|jgi:hypothetical protein|nr:YaiI/YqxD family protein [Arenicellales bacterium]